jgi:hypothetical protein
MKVIVDSIVDAIKRLIEIQEKCCVNRVLYTQDGRQIGNCIVIKGAHRDALGQTVCKLISDHGNTVCWNVNTIRDRFYIGGMATESHKHFTPDVEATDE